MPARLVSGVGWVPTNTMISALGPIGDTPFGATGDLILVPDEATEVHVDFDDGSAAEHFYLGDIRHTDGRPWECCPREFLRRGLAALKEAAGLELFAAFEHELVYTGVEDVPGSPYSLDAWRRQGIFGEVLVAAMRKAGVEPDTFLPEYAKRQYEVTCAPALGMKAADDAVKLREMARAAAFRLGHRAIFSPILDPNGTGSGVHIHFSFKDGAGRPAMYDPGGAYGLTPVAQSFMAGVLAHLPAICAVTAPSPDFLFPASPKPLGADLGLRRRPRPRGVPQDLPGARSPGQGCGGAIQRGVPAGRCCGEPLSRARRNGACRRGRHPEKLALPEPRNVAAMDETRATRRRASAICRNRSARRSTISRRRRRRRTGSARSISTPISVTSAPRSKWSPELPEAEQCDLYAQTY